MHLVYFRALLKVFFFLFIILFILLFVVYWYRYNKNIWFIQKNVFMTMNFWSDHNEIKVAWNRYLPEDKKIVFYNLDSWCYNIEYNWNTYYRCFKNNQSSEQSFVTYEGKSKLWAADLLKNCYDFDRLYHDWYCIKNKCFSDKIVDVFTYEKINFIQTNNTLFYCDSDFESCKDLTQLSGHLLCANTKWLISLENDWYYLYKLK